MITQRVLLPLPVVLRCCTANAQTEPNITSWLINTTNIMGHHYVSANPTPIQDAVLANVQNVKYSASWVYVTTNGIPSYITGPYLDGNPSVATSQNAIFRFPRVPVQNTGTPTATTGGDIGNFINGVALFDYRDGVSWKFSTNALAGGPLGGTGDGVWNRDAVVAERVGFDCAKGHPAMGNYHHHQNPSAFSLDIVPISTVCSVYAADGLYTIDSTRHSPLLGFAWDGFPIYGAYGFANADGTGGLKRILSSYQLRNITVRTHYADGTNVTDGPVVNATYPLGLFREDYEFITHAEPYYLDVHNGRFCVTPEYPGGTYAYFCTVNANWNSAYPYCVGPTFYGVKSAAKVASVSEAVTTYTYLKVAARVYLSGAYDSGTGLMSDALRSSSYVPTTQPYTSLGYTFTGALAASGSIAPGILGYTGNNAIVDWVVLELRNPATPTTIIASAPALLQRDGDVVAMDGLSVMTFPVAPGNYYVAIRHRNHLAAMTAAAVALGVNSTIVDLTSTTTGTYGTDAQNTAGSVRTLWNGDVNFDGAVKYTGSGNDRDPILTTVGGTTPNNSVVGYQAGDINLDGSVKYTGSGNDRDPILINVGSTTPNNVRNAQLP